ncbi:antibiotic biosynthesis monooxygenase [Isoptericola sp. NEAU-Y5]|uniref:Antibiotic biosynthesis monooxygenase n=1 Tax=Isoptericola luteus TaxID=2879484 RepID=A0ABS7ZCU5_9MICO|nr:antibiotic biosynthesis monooxygenase [Isoptericola sp. NEAU-Y5]MCA5892272.1 antibiotic biosynthesis monooxygenase [Isoptericola sp. NEAU-Y5]
MTVEYVRYAIDPDRAEEFERAFARAATPLRQSPYCRTFDLSRCVEEPSSYVLRIVWTSADDHLEKFRRSPQFRQFFGEVRGFVDSMTEMRHYEPVPVMPSLYDWAGGGPALERLFEVFYAKVADDDVLGPVFAEMSPDHPKHVAAWIGEVFGGPAAYSTRRGGHRGMVRHHVGRRITERQRRRWSGLLLDAADEVGLPDDPEFRSAFAAYVEWGTRLAVSFSSAGAETDVAEPMPRWGWGEVRPWPPA